jgi:hypothetical protein
VATTLPEDCKESYPQDSLSAGVRAFGIYRIGELFRLPMKHGGAFLLHGGDFSDSIKQIAG